MVKSLKLCLAIALALIVPLTMTAPAYAILGHHKTTSTSTHRNFVHRHKLLTSMAAGVAAYKISKHTGKNRAAAGGKKNWAQRHPFLTGMGAAAATHHVLKKTDHRH